jgi:hypothetical protein
VLVFKIPAHSQDVCANNYVQGMNCYGPNNCTGYMVRRFPQFGGNQTCLEGYFIYCCDQQYQDFSDSGETCSEECDDGLKAILKDPNAVEFTFTHTLWAADCSGHYRPFSRTWDVTQQPIILRKPRLNLSGIGS